MDVQTDLFDAEDQSAVDIVVALCKSIPFDKEIDASNNNDDNNCKVLSSDEIVQCVVDFVQDVNGIVQLKPTVTRMLLSYCNWDKTVLTERFYDNPEKLFKNAGVTNPFSEPKRQLPLRNECDICCDDLITTPGVTNTCGHTFCASCWSKYLKTKIMDDGVGNSILCPKSNCDVIIDDEMVIDLVGDEEVKRRYQHLITNSFVQKNQLFRWCPAPQCSYAAKINYTSFKPVCCDCKCGHQFCFDCAEEWHDPIPCALMKSFKTFVEQIKRPNWVNQRPNVDRTNFLFDRVVAFNIADDRIKLCPNPNCSISIQKVFGCNVMLCKHCQTNFCWSCLRKFRNRADAYSHSCLGEPKAVNGTTETEGNKVNDGLEREGTTQPDNEQIPPRKFLKLRRDAATQPDQNIGSKANSPTESTGTLTTGSSENFANNEQGYMDRQVEDIKQDNGEASGESKTENGTWLIPPNELRDRADVKRQIKRCRRELVHLRRVELQDRLSYNADHFVNSDTNQRIEEVKTESASDDNKTKNVKKPNDLDRFTGRHGNTPSMFSGLPVTLSSENFVSDGKESAKLTTTDVLNSENVPRRVERNATDKEQDAHFQLGDFFKWHRAPFGPMRRGDIPRQSPDLPKPRRPQNVHLADEGAQSASLGSEMKVFAALERDLKKRERQAQYRNPKDRYTPVPEPIDRRQGNRYYENYVSAAAEEKSAVTELAQITDALSRRGKSRDVSLYESAAKFLVQSRRTLKYIAVFVMYLKNFDKFSLIEYFRHELQMAAHELSFSISLVKLDNPTTYNHIAQSVVPSYRKCQRQHRTLLDYINEGYDNEWWSFEGKPVNFQW